MALRVLLADESSTIKRVMQLALQDFGVEVKAVPVGLDVLPVAKTFQPDIIFADVLLVKRNGYEVCADLKADAEMQSVPVVLMWSSFMEVDEAKLNQSAPDARLEKPFDADALRQLVKDLVPKTQSNPISSYLQFPKMPEFNETPTPKATAVQERPKASQAAPGPTKPMAKLPDSVPVNFDKFDPTGTTMIRVDEWTDFEAHDLAELALSVSDEILGHGGAGEAELARLDTWLDEAIVEGDCDEVRRQL